MALRWAHAWAVRPRPVDLGDTVQAHSSTCTAVTERAFAHLVATFQSTAMFLGLISEALSWTRGLLVPKFSWQ